ncbi:MAG: 1-acyl-sn-glycerol-3-phosphate acyltransferase [Actinobacteria bacterium]|nr:1-acyl-sn-glycerol-3-phosphate acyltransferase [Micrococcales bacterium]MCB0903946.1 1-acyl-sn-glycerol-3-phosphate acyltransferase [Actinomycetota bacterium]MCO5300226.1 1-acyl-sn-glycerol-3-phosphate acyltransferase [Candidatus Nanopelagicales bacterium]MCB9430037.1 1-acyl-sn-glycerol-3-phosphate acyltransferase [Actinomycetota bacterium]HPE12282.1 lysophospholipid acyltransferase family protein [Actinomycetota bacterium]
MKQVGSLVFWGFVVLSSILLFPVAVLIWLVTVLFDRRLVLLHRFTCFWASLYTWLNPLWPVTITGRENIRPGTTYVLAANHLSLLDILVLFRLFKDFKWVSKAEIFKVPLIGWNMSMNRYIRLQRGQRDSVVQMMKQAQQTLESGSSIMMFPEGTRSKSGELQRFKTGAFELALATGVPVVPIVISGTHNALPKHGFVLQGRHEIGVHVLAPVDPIGTSEQLCEQVRALIAEQVR